MKIESRLIELGITLPETPKPVAAYVPAVCINEWLFTSGQLPLEKGELKYRGKVGETISKEQAYQAARICALNALSAAKSVVGTLDKIERVVKVVGFVNSGVGFSEQPAVINGASELLKLVFGDQGAHARSAVGVAGLPLDAAVEVEIIFKIKGEL